MPTNVTRRPFRTGQLAVLAVIIVLAACASARLTPPSPVVATPGPTIPPVASGSTRSTTPHPTEVPGPPRAALVRAASAAVDGALGTFTWDDGGSDAPWIVPPAEQAVVGVGPFFVAFRPPLPVQRWTASWAPVTTGGGGAPVSGTGGTVVTGPVLGVGTSPGPGTWSLAVTARFGAGREATWFWRVESTP